MKATQEKRQTLAGTSSPEVCHLFCCCSPALGLCGQRLDEWVDDSPATDECVVCVDLLDCCPRCGESL